MHVTKKDSGRAKKVGQGCAARSSQTSISELAHCISLRCRAEPKEPLLTDREWSAPSSRGSAAELLGYPNFTDQTLCADSRLGVGQGQWNTMEYDIWSDM